jgi:glutathione S-transferase
MIVDDGCSVADSWTIAIYLEDAYPDRPPLFGSKQERALARFYNQWTDVTLHGAIGPIVVSDILQHLDPRDRDYFRISREARLGATLETLATRRESYLSTLQQVLEPLRQTLAAQSYLAGDTPLYPDFIVFGAFQWARSISNVRLVQPSDPIDSWRQRLLDATASRVAHPATGKAENRETSAAHFAAKRYFKDAALNTHHSRGIHPIEP